MASRDVIAPSPPDSTPVVAVDVECVATGTTHNDRAVAQIAIVDARTERVVLDVYVKPTMPVTSYLTPLTGITETLLNERGVSFDEALGMVRAVLSPGHVVVGQGVLKDMNWLRLERGTDYGDLIDLAGIWRVWNDRFKSWSVFSQDHLVRTLLGTSVDEAHDAVGDCVKSSRAWLLYERVKNSPDELAAARAKLLAVPPEPSFAKRFPSFEGVCQGIVARARAGRRFLASRAVL